MERREKLQFGIMCADLALSDWEAEVVEKLLQVDGVDLQLVITDSDSGTDSDGGKVSTFLEYRDRTDTVDAVNFASWWAYRQYLGGDGPPCRRNRDVSNLVGDVETIECNLRQDGFATYVSDADVVAIRAHDLDFVLRFSFGILRGEILDVPRYGIWSFHHNDEQKYRGVPPCFWAVYNRDHVTGAILQRLTERLDGGIVLRRGFFATEKTSWQANLNNVYYGSTEWPAQVATDILNGTAEYLDDPPTESDAPIYRAPSPVQLLRYTSSRYRSKVRAASSGIDYWNVGVVEKPLKAYATDQTVPEVHWFQGTGQDGYIADPFPAQISGETYIFVEDYSYADGKGKISYIQYPDGFEDGVLRTAHEADHHLSYPFVFETEGVTYALPECCQTGEIRVYEVHAPDRWELQDVLVTDVAAVDPTLLQADDRWWLFFTEQGAYENAKLHIWYADDLFGEWRPHANNPVKTDVRSARPGGKPFVSEDVPFRPAQNCAKRYGWKVSLNRINELTPTRYREAPVGMVDPGDLASRFDGCHTLGGQGDLTVIDGVQSVYNRHWLRMRSQILTDRFPWI